jgi:predicted DNA-binding ribbon-helix-helix protein
MAESRLINRNVTASRGRTSMRLEPELWDALEEICRRERVTMADLVRRIEQTGHPGGRTSAVRVHVLGYFRHAARLAAFDGHVPNGRPADGQAPDGGEGWPNGQPGRETSAA